MTCVLNQCWERELSYDVPISPMHFEKLKNIFDSTLVYQEFVFYGTEKFKIRLGSFGVIRKTIKSDSKYYLHTSLYNNIPPIVYTLKVSIEETLDKANPSWQLQCQNLIQVERFFTYRNGWREAVTRQISKTGHSVYWYNLEKENISKPNEEDFKELEELIDNFWKTYKAPLLPRVPFKDQRIGFIHSTTFPTSAVQYKYKIDGINFIANYSEEGGWTSRCPNSKFVDEELKKLKLKNNHIVLFGEYRLNKIYITEVAYVRNFVAYVNLEEYHTLSGNKEDKLINVDLYNSSKALIEMSKQEIIEINCFREGIPDRIIPDHCDGYLLIDQAYRYIKLKINHTIEVLMKDGFLFCRFGKLMIPIKIEKAVFQYCYQNKIIELKKENNILRFVKVRTDKVLPDTIEKIWQILLL